MSEPVIRGYLILKKNQNKSLFLETDRKLGARLRQMSEIGRKKLRTDVH